MFLVCLLLSRALLYKLFNSAVYYVSAFVFFYLSRVCVFLCGQYQGDGAKHSVTAIGADEPHGADPEDTASHVERTMEQVTRKSIDEKLAAALLIHEKFPTLLIYEKLPTGFVLQYPSNSVTSFYQMNPRRFRPSCRRGKGGGGERWSFSTRRKTPPPSPPSPSLDSMYFFISGD